MEYISTRDRDMVIGGAEAILEGISKEGGLFVPKSLPFLGELKDLIDMDYKELALFILGGFFPDLGKENLGMAVDMAYDEKFSVDEMVALKNVGGVNFLELYHGPTLAFKDMALSLLPHLLNIAREKLGLKEEIVILTATSGDTGKAALEGFANVEGVKIIVFYPQDGVSEIQKLQMQTQEGKNTLVVGIRGNFDDAQSGVKYIFNNKQFKDMLEKDSHILSSANSINIGRLVPQIIYYVYSYCKMVKNGEIELGDRINIVVPTGNFGNILAAYYAKEMGLPVNKLICASNDNKVLTEFLTEGKYNIKRDLILSSSPSMDILISSNLERLLFHLSRGNHDLVKEKMANLSQEGYYEILDLNSEDFYGNFSKEEEVTEAIREVFEEEKYLMDPHTAVAYGVYKKYRDESKDKTKTIIASTASPFKFGGKVAQSIGIDLEGKDEFTILEDLSGISGIKIPDNIRNLKGRKARHKGIILKEEMEGTIRGFLKVGRDHD